MVSSTVHTMLPKIQAVLVHGYYHIKPNQLWDTIDIDLPELKLSIKKFLEELEKEES